MISDGFTSAGRGARRQRWRVVRRLRRLVVQRQQFERQRRLQRRRRQLWRRRRIGELVAWASGASAGISLEHRWRLRRIFPPNVLARIEQAIKAGEATHSGQVRFVVEGALDGAPLFRNQPARERALDIFSQLRIWDTAHNNGVLIYLLLADHDCRDRRRPRHRRQGRRTPAGKKSAARWKRISGQGISKRGVIKGIEAVSRELAKHFPRSGGGPNELPDAPVVM